MPIRGSIKAPPKGGYPDLHFVEYRQRFGVMQAVMLNAKMQYLAGRCLEVKGNASGEVQFYSEEAFQRLIDNRRERNLPVQRLERILANWPETEHVPRGHLYRPDFVYEWGSLYPIRRQKDRKPATAAVPKRRLLSKPRRDHVE